MSLASEYALITANLHSELRQSEEENSRKRGEIIDLVSRIMRHLEESREFLESEGYSWSRGRSHDSFKLEKEWVCITATCEDVDIIHLSLQSLAPWNRHSPHTVIATTIPELSKVIAGWILSCDRVGTKKVGT
jgi:hypothetical protein